MILDAVTVVSTTKVNYPVYDGPRELWQNGRHLVASWNYITVRYYASCVFAHDQGDISSFIQQSQRLRLMFSSLCLADNVLKVH